MTTGVVQKEGTCWYQLGERNDWYFLPGMTTWFLSVWTRGSGPFLSPFITLAMSRCAAILRDGLCPTGEPHGLPVSPRPASTSSAAWLKVPGDLLDVTAAFPSFTVEEGSLQKANRCFPGRRN